MKLHTKTSTLRAASYGAVAAACMSLAADLSVIYTLVFAVGWDVQDPVHTGLPWLVPIGLLTALTLGLFRAADRLAFKAQAAERRAEVRAACLRAEDRRRRA